MNDFETIENVGRGGDDPRVVAVPGAQHLPEVALLGFGGNSGRWAGALDVNHDNRRLDHGRHPEAFGHQRKAASGGGAHGPHARVRSSDRHVHDPDFILHLPDHDARFASVGGHPVQHTSGRAHRIRAIELDSCRRASHRQGHVSGQHRLTGVRHRQRLRKWLKVVRGVVIGATGDFDILGDDGIALFLELLAQYVGQCLKTDAHHAQAGSHCERILLHFVSAVVRQLRNRKGTEPNAFLRRAGRNGVSVVDHGRSRG